MTPRFKFDLSIDNQDDCVSVDNSNRVMNGHQSCDNDRKAICQASCQPVICTPPQTQLATLVNTNALGSQVK